MKINPEAKYIIRCQSAGVFYARIAEKNGDELTLTDARRLWRWHGANTLSQLAVDGSKEPERCHFTVAVPEMTVIGAIEIIPCSEKAIQSIEGIPVWKQ